MTDATPYTVPREPGRWRALALAAVVHAVLFCLLWFGIRWQNETPDTIEAEVWSPQPQEAAPRPEPVPEQKLAPQPVVKETPVPLVKPDIALEQEKKRKEQVQKAHAEEKKAEEKRLEKEKIDAAERKKREAAETQQLAKARDDEMRRITGGVTGTGGTGNATKTQGSRNDASYAQQVGAKIKSNINFNVPDDLVGNPPVEFVVELLPDGSVGTVRKTKSSGVQGFDDAVRRAIEKSQPYPRDKSGAVPSSFIGTHRPKDQ